MHPLVETFVDSQLEAYSTEEEETYMSLSPLIGQLRTMKKGWGDLIGTEISPVAERVATRERFLTSHIARNPCKLLETELTTEDYKFSMIKNTPKVGAVRIYMDPESKYTSFGGITADTFQGVATLITPKDAFKMEGARWHLFSEVFSSSEGMATDLDRKRFPPKTMDKDPKYKSFSWKVLQQAKSAMGATTYIRDTTLPSPPFFDNAIRGGDNIVGCQGLGPASN